MNCHGHGRNPSIFPGSFSKLYYVLYTRMCIRDIQRSTRIYRVPPRSCGETRGFREDSNFVTSDEVELSVGEQIYLYLHTYMHTYAQIYLTCVISPQWIKLCLPEKPTLRPEPLPVNLTPTQA